MAWPQRPAGGRARAHGGAGVAGGVGRLRPQARVAAPGRLDRAQELGLDALAAGAAQDDGGRGHGDAAVRRGGDHACPSRRRVRRNAGLARSVMRIRSTRWCPVAIRSGSARTIHGAGRRPAAGPPRTAGARGARQRTRSRAMPWASMTIARERRARALARARPAVVTGAPPSTGGASTGTSGTAGTWAPWSDPPADEPGVDEGGEGSGSWLRRRGLSQATTRRWAICRC